MEKMMIPDNYKPIRQVGNGKTVSFSFDFPMLSENFIKVYREQDGVQELVDPSEYVWGYIPVEGEDAPVEDIAPENVITFYEAPADGVVIVIAREIPLEQTTPYKTSSGFPAVRVEDNFDKLTAITQQLTETLERCVKVEITDDQDPQDLIDDVFEKLDTATEVGEQAIKTAQETQELVEGSKALIQEETQKAIEQLGSSSDEIINKARIWAEGEQAEVQELGGELSSKGWALQASNSATSANQSATQAKTSETNAKSYAEALQSLLPNQIGNAGKYLTTDGTSPKWAEVVSTTITYWE